MADACRKSEGPLHPEVWNCSFGLYSRMRRVLSGGGDSLRRFERSESKVSKLAHSEHTFRSWKTGNGTESSFPFKSVSWVRAMAENSVGSGQEEQHG